MKKLTTRNILFFIAVGCLYFAGVAAILYPMVSNILSLSTSKTVIKEYVSTVENMPSEEINDTLASARKYNQDVASFVFNDGLERVLCDENGLVCYVDVPSVNIYLPVYYGATEENLVKGAAMLENTSLPVGGKSTHSVISGHTGLPTAEMFTKLDQVKTGEVFYIHVLDLVLAYKIDKITVVYPNMVTDLTVVKDEDHVTLLTCTPYGINDKRLLVRGTRMPYDPPKKEETAAVPVSADTSADDALEKEIRHQTAITAAIAIVSVILFIFALVWFMTSVKKPDNAPEGQDVTQKTD